jgi:predicted lipid-binding transport protein (Tim44 family)
LRTSISVFIAAAMVFLIGCGSQSNTSTASPNTNSNVVAANANAATNSATAAAPASDAPAGSLATPTEAYKTAYAVREKKDVEGLKKIMSKDVLEFLSMMAEADKKTLDDLIKDIFVKPQAPEPKTRNEKISGDHATVEYIDEKGEWSVMDFSKEDGVWKMSLPDKGDIQIETSPVNKKSDKP